MNFDFTCTASRIMLDLPHQIWEAESADPIGNVLITRLLHNKIGFILSNYSRCYLSYFSPDYIANHLTVIGAILFFVGVYLLFLGKSKLIVLALLAPLPALFELFPVAAREIILLAGYIIVCIYGIFKFFKK